MRAAGALALLFALTGSARADDPFEASGFVGVGTFGTDSELGNSWAPEQVPSTAPVFGARFGWLALPAFAGSPDGVHLGAGLEVEASFATAFTDSADADGRMSYFAPVFGWRAHGKLRLGGLATLAPHLIAGAGGETIASSSPYMAKETDAVFYWGVGTTIGLTDRWLLRLDLRHGLMAARDDGMTSTLEAQLGLATRFGGKPAAVGHATVVTPEPPVAPVIPEPPVVAAPPADPDGDGLVDAADKCPDGAEDFDNYADEDGCPDPDNDNDGFEDGRDSCPLAGETRNGIDDGDGCPDTIPEEVTKALAVGAKLRFERARARVTPAARTTLRPLYLMLLAHPDVKIRITAYPEKQGDEDLAKRRADAVKWWLVDQGITEGRIAISLGDVGKQVIDLTLRAD